MATIETNAELGEQIVADAKEFVLYSWSAERDQPDRSRRRRGTLLGLRRQRYLDFASQLVNVSIGHQHPKVITAIKEQAERSVHDRAADGERVTPAPGPAARGGHARRPVDVVLHERRRRGERERDQARTLVHGPAQDRRALPLLPRRHRRRDHADRRPAPLAAEPGIPGSSGIADPYTYRCPAGHPSIRARSAPARPTSRRSSSTRARKRSRP